MASTSHPKMTVLPIQKGLPFPQYCNIPALHVQATTAIAVTDAMTPDRVLLMTPVLLGHLQCLAWLWSWGL